jgi:RNA polymerase sigma-70 factor (ECF subfamily)
MPADELDRMLVARIRQGESGAWEECIARFEGRLQAFVESRLRNRATAEDVVQETFLGFLISLPNYDDTTPLESFLFSIAAHKLTDVLRRQGRRPELALLLEDSQGGVREPAGSGRAASSLFRSAERQSTESRALADALQTMITQWWERGEFERLKCIELLFVLGWKNKEVAEHLAITEQDVANHKHFVVSKIREAIAKFRINPDRLSKLGLEE